MRMPTNTTRLTATLAVMACTAMPAVADDFYAGKQITLIVGAGPGGGYDLQARVAARHLGRHIPGHPAIVVQNLAARHLGKHIAGNPTIIVQNMPAAGGLAATQHIYNVAPKDGTVIGLVQRGMLLAKWTSPAGARFEIEKFGWLGSLTSETAMVTAFHTAPHSTAQDLFERELIVGGTAGGADPETSPKLYNALLGTKFKIVAGYESTTRIALAMERGEVQGLADWSLSSIKSMRPDWLRDKQIKLLMQGALQKHPELPDVPSALDFVKNDTDRKVLQLYFTQKTAARPVIAPPGLPPERLAILRNAFRALATDEAFLAEGAKASMDVSPISGEEMEKIVALITATPNEVAERLTQAIGPPK
jgi:tripartite-type tricarboxylate transporter receptor subunit TctC